MELLLTLLVLITTAFLLVAFMLSLQRQDVIKQRLDIYTRTPKTAAGESRLKPQIDLAGLLSRVSRVFASRSYTQKVQADLVRAGIPLKGEEFVTIWLGLALLVPGLVWLMTLNWGLAFLAVAAGGIGPHLYLKSRIEKRRLQLNQQLGDALIIMANALRAGFSFQQAMETVRQELPAPISLEFEWTLREMNLGAGTEEALLNIGERAGSEDLDMVVTAVLIQRQVGGNLAAIMENISHTIRERARIKGEIRTLTAQGRISGLIIGFLPVILFFFLLTINPTYMSVMLNHPAGIYMLGGALVSEIIGALIINKIVEIDY